MQLVNQSLHVDFLVYFSLPSSLLLFLCPCGNGAVSEYDCRLTVAFAVTMRKSDGERVVTYTWSMCLLFVCLCALCSFMCVRQEMEPYHDASH